MRRPIDCLVSLGPFHAGCVGKSVSSILLETHTLSVCPCTRNGGFLCLKKPVTTLPSTKTQSQPGNWTKSISHWTNLEDNALESRPHGRNNNGSLLPGGTAGAHQDVLRRFFDRSGLH
jgi:hypothetical protein